MQILRRAEEARGFGRRCRSRGERVALVPTMGFLHEGHLSLVRLAKSKAERVVVSVFVNPAQFAPGEDCERYPRDLERDLALLEREGVDAVFTPDATEVYPPGFATRVTVEGALTGRLCGASRPGHFAGVATMVAKLFASCEPDLAVFGQKDAQQAAVIRRMTEDLNLPVEVVVGPIVREADGLAMSSRNVYLTPEERLQAPALKRALDRVTALHQGGEVRAAALLEAAREAIASAPLARVDYVELVDCQSFEPVDAARRPALLALAVYFGRTRLIDNTVLGPSDHL